MSNPTPFDLEALRRRLVDVLAAYQKLLEALTEATIAFQDDQEKGMIAALHAVNDNLPHERTEPLRALEVHLEYERSDRNQREPAHSKNRDLAIFEAFAAAAVDKLAMSGGTSIEAACRRVSAAFTLEGDWKKLRNLRNHLRKGNGRREAVQAYWDCRDVFINQRPLVLAKCYLPSWARLALNWMHQ
jgi:hypothetical protein